MVVQNPGSSTPVQLMVETVENGMVTPVAMIMGQGTEALMRSGRLFRIMSHLVHGEEVDAADLIPDKDDEAGVLPGTRTIRE